MLASLILIDALTQKALTILRTTEPQQFQLLYQELTNYQLSTTSRDSLGYNTAAISLHATLTAMVNQTFDHPDGELNRPTHSLRKIKTNRLRFAEIELTIHVDIVEG